MSAGHTGKLAKKRGVHVDIEEMAGRKKGSAIGGA
jgi:hypothetical protein